MLVLIDESGCPGFKQAKGSTEHFVIGMVRFDSFGEAERASAEISQLRSRLRVNPEFKFNNCSDEIRDKFFRSLIQYDFKIRSLVVTKAKIYSMYLRSDATGFYNFFTRLMLEHDNGTLVGARVKIDGSGSRKFRQALSTYLKKRLESGKISSVSFVDSRSDSLIQLADMCVGAIARSYRGSDRGNQHRWRDMLRPRIEDIWNYE